MATYNYRPEAIQLSINGRLIQQFGKNDNGVETETNDDKNMVTRLLNGDSVITGRLQEGATQTIYLARGSKDAQFMQSAYDNATVLGSAVNVMSEGNESVVCSEGAVTKVSSVNHFGTEIDDAVFTVQYGKITIRHNKSV